MPGSAAAPQGETGAESQAALRGVTPLLQAEFDVLLYDLISSYVEGVSE